MNKKVSTKNTYAIFLAVVLIVGTFAAVYPSFIIGIQAQADYENGYGYDNNNNSYNSAEYPPSAEYESNNEKDNYYYLPPKHPNQVSSDIVVPIDFPTIQEAIDEANEDDTIKVLPGAYTEQITISKSLTIIGSGAKSTIINAPAVLNNGVIGFPYIVELNNGAEVSMKGFTISGYEVSNCGNTPFDGVTGINVQEDATLNLDSSTIRDCTFIAVRVVAPPFLANGEPVPNGPQVGHATITKTYVTDYSAFGILAFTPDTTLTITKSNIIASDTSNFLGQVGILVESDAKGIITNNKVSGNICDILPDCGSNFFTQFQGYRIIVDSTPGSIVSNNYVSNNEVGIGVFGISRCCIVEDNKLKDNRFFGIIINDGDHTISNTKIFGGNVGAAAIAFSANTTATLDHVKIVDAGIPIQALSTGNLNAAVNVLSPSFFLP